MKRQRPWLWPRLPRELSPKRAAREIVNAAWRSPEGLRLQRLLAKVVEDAERWKADEGEVVGERGTEQLPEP